METNLNSWFHNQFTHQQSSYLNSLNSPLCYIPPYTNPSENITSLKGSSNIAQKRFLVFDQSGDQTTMFYTPAIGPQPIQLPSEVPIPKPVTYYSPNILNREKSHYQTPIFACAYDGIQRDDTKSEMHEDTEEIDALLYSDDEYCEEEEEASTGHSPSTLTHFDRDCGEEIEEVASNFEPNKRIKLSPLGSDDLKICSECEDDAESSCGDGENLNLGAEKRSRREEIRERLRLLQRIIPGGKGMMNKDSILVFDEAIDYLKSLKVGALGLGIHSI